MILVVVSDLPCSHRRRILINTDTQFFITQRLRTIHCIDPRTARKLHSICRLLFPQPVGPTNPTFANVSLPDVSWNVFWFGWKAGYLALAIVSPLCAAFKI